MIKFMNIWMLSQTIVPEHISIYIRLYHTFYFKTCFGNTNHFLPVHGWMWLKRLNILYRRMLSASWCFLYHSEQTAVEANADKTIDIRRPVEQLSVKTFLNIRCFSLQMSLANTYAWANFEQTRHWANKMEFTKLNTRCSISLRQVIWRKKLYDIIIVIVVAKYRPLKFVLYVNLRAKKKSCYDVYVAVSNYVWFCIHMTATM